MLFIFAGMVEELEERISKNPIDVKALSSQGSMYVGGQLCQVNESRGIDFITRAAALNDGVAMHNMGFLSEMGKLTAGIPDPLAAEEWYLKAHRADTSQHVSGVRYQFLASTRLVRAAMALSTHEATATDEIKHTKVFAFPKLFTNYVDTDAWSRYLPRQRSTDTEAEYKLRRLQHLAADAAAVDTSHPSHADATSICHDLYEISSRQRLRLMDINAHLKKATPLSAAVTWRFHQPFYCAEMKRTCIAYIHPLTEGELESKTITFPDGKKNVSFVDMNESLAEELFQSDLDVAFDAAVEVAEVNSGRRWFNLSLQEQQDYISLCWTGSLQLFEFKERGDILKMQHLVADQLLKGEGKGDRYMAAIKGVEMNGGIPTLLWSDDDLNVDEKKRRDVTLEVCRQLWELICADKTIRCSLDMSMNNAKTAPLTGSHLEKNFSDVNLHNSLVGDILFEGDVALKHVVSGLTWRQRKNDPSIFYVTPSSLQMEDYQEMLNRSNALRDKCPAYRVCFVFEKLNCLEYTDKKVIHFEDLAIHVEYSARTMDNGPTATETGLLDFVPEAPDVKLASDAKRAVAMYLETNFRKFASQSPALFAIQEIGRLYGMLKYLREMGLSSVPFIPKIANPTVGGLGSSATYWPIFPRTCYLSVADSSQRCEGGVRLDTLQLVRLPAGDDPRKGYKMKDGSICTRNQVTQASAAVAMIDAVPIVAVGILVPGVAAKVNLGCATEYIESRVEDVGKPPEKTTMLEKVGAAAAKVTKELTKGYGSSRMKGT